MTDISPVERIFCALDTPNLDEALLLAEILSGEVGAIKLGKEFFTAHGPDGVRQVGALGHKIFLDLKYHDIPNTVFGAVRATERLGCSVLTVHASGGLKMLEAAASAAAELGPKRPKIVAVTVLTSLDDDDLAVIGQKAPVSQQVLQLARLAKVSGIDGVVCSPKEAAMLRVEIGDEFSLVVPGVRPAWVSSDDQKRVMTPAEAVAAGADHLVIGRPITRAEDPAGAARRIADEILAAR
ncbi:MAG: orotidine-5'-phosphate decarboxylase [Pelagibacteraceae bacterium]|nr:orotidine-5'-phosphate decarboxylase [Pelagibacteraceae bacterium]PPR10852.1 MAG: Orotidine 5'-phosphate decarboxylase [Alphaproteobacteria bacterium MarineAlpha11_Bin1]|tara:strand:- start:43376 stop:44092 length:717 start_codon:yes stop_codon:yes gene_type:complete